MPSEIGNQKEVIRDRREMAGPAASQDVAGIVRLQEKNFGTMATPKSEGR